MFGLAAVFRTSRVETQIARSDLCGTCRSSNWTRLILFRSWNIVLFRYRDGLPGEHKIFLHLPRVLRRALTRSSLLQMWRYQIHGNVFSYPVIRTHESANSEHLVSASHNKNLYCLETPRDIAEEKSPRLRCTLQLHSPIFATPWCEDGHAFVACTDGTLQVFDLSEGKLLASKQLPGETFSSPIVHHDLAVLGCRDNNLYVLKLS